MLPKSLVRLAKASAGDPIAALEVATECVAALGEPSSDRPAPRLGSAAEVQAMLTELAEVDLTVARVVEPHLDAQLIFAEAGLGAPAGRWGVFAAEAPAAQLNAEQGAQDWRLTGTKAWCSLAGALDCALVTARAGQGSRLFAVDLRQPGIQIEDAAGWAARGLSGVVSMPVRFSAARAEPVGGPEWYLKRPGFAWGGIRVAACWYGGMRAIHDQLRMTLTKRDAPDAIRQVSLGKSELACWTAKLALDHAATEIDAGRADGRAGALLAARARAVVADGVETVLRESAHALGPAPLCFDAAHARRVADLQLYVRQHHAERDLATLADLLTSAG